MTINKNYWKIADVKARFSEVLELSKKTPQIICNRDKPVGVVLPIHFYQHLIELKRQHDTPTLKDFLDQIHQIQTENYVEIEIPSRENRSSSFSDPDHEMDV